MFAERADEIFRKFITLVNISAHLAYESFLAFRFRLWFYIVLIVVVGHGLDFGDHTDSVMLQMNIPWVSMSMYCSTFRDMKELMYFGRKASPLSEYSGWMPAPANLSTVLPLWNPKVWKMSNGASWTGSSGS